MFPIFMSPGKPLPIAEEALGVGDAPDTLLPFTGRSAEAACGESQVPCVVATPFALVVGVPCAMLPLSDKKPYMIRISFALTGI
jgi:hypothetical protein